MKRLLYFSILAAFLCGCNSASHEGQGSATDAINIDSVSKIVSEPTIEPAEPEPEPEPEPPFTSSDLKWQQLQGHVKQLKIIGEYGYVVYNFDRQGNFISYHDSSNLKYDCKRKNGRIVESDLGSEDSDLGEYNKYYYNADGYVCRQITHAEEGIDDVTYVLNENGWPVSAKSEVEDFIPGDDEVSYYSLNYQYNYTNIDDRGNWTKCIVKCREGGPVTNITRKITYWK